MRIDEDRLIQILFLVVIGCWIAIAAICIVSLVLLLLGAH